MKKIITIALIACFCVINVNAAEKEASKPTLKDWVVAMTYNKARGLVNCLTCWVELPRGMFYESLRNPYFGIIPGTVNGAFLSVVRAFGGVTDVLTDGLTGPSIYGDSFPEYVWQSKWIAEDAMIMPDVKKAQEEK